MVKTIKRTVAFFNPNEKKKAEMFLKKYRKAHPKIKVILEKHKKWETLDVKKVMVVKSKKRSSPNYFSIFR